MLKTVLALVLLLGGCAANPPIGQSPAPTAQAKAPAKIVEAKGFKFEVTNYEIVEKIQNPGAEVAIEAPGGQLVIVYYKVTNVSKKTAQSLEIPISLVDNQGREYLTLQEKTDLVVQAFWLQALNYGNRADSQFPGQSIVTAEIFKTPKDATGLIGTIDGQPIELIKPEPLKE